MSLAPARCTAFQGSRRLASGPLMETALAAKAAADGDPALPVQLFDDDTGQPVEVDLRGGPQDVARRLAERFAAPDEAEAPRGRGRPKLGVVAREVTLLPRHWDWLAAQPGGASVALRKLVETARRDSEAPARRRLAQTAAYRFISALAGNEAGFEEASRALFAGDPEAFARHSEAWPADVGEHARRLAAASWPQVQAAQG